MSSEKDAISTFAVGTKHVSSPHAHNEAHPSNLFPFCVFNKNLQAYAMKFRFTFLIF